MDGLKSAQNWCPDSFEPPDQEYQLYFRMRQLKTCLKAAAVPKTTKINVSEFNQNWCMDAS